MVFSSLTQTLTSVEALKEVLDEGLTKTVSAAKNFLYYVYIGGFQRHTYPEELNMNRYVIAQEHSHTMHSCSGDQIFQTSCVTTTLPPHCRATWTDLWITVTRKTQHCHQPPYPLFEHFRQKDIFTDITINESLFCLLFTKQFIKINVSYIQKSRTRERRDICGSVSTVLYNLFLIREGIMISILIVNQHKSHLM